MRVPGSAVAVAVAVGVVICLGAGGWGAPATEAQATRARVAAVSQPLQANMLAAGREAQHLLSLGRAPVGAMRLISAPACKPIDEDLGTPAVSSIVVAQRSWRVHEPEAQLASWLYAHPPAGLQLTTWMGAAAGSGGPWGYDANATAQWQSAQLGVGAAYLGPSSSAICLDAVVIWLDPRPWPDNVPGTRAHVSVGAGCPASDAKLVGVRNPGADLTARLLPAGEPTAALVCNYNGYNDASIKSPELSLAMRLAHQVRLEAPAAARLAAAVAALPLSHVDGGVTSCPADQGTAAILAFSYSAGSNHARSNHARLDVDIWVSETGCAFLANGYIRTGWVTTDVVNLLHRYS